MKLLGRKVFVLGAGASGRAAALLAADKGAVVHVYDERESLAKPFPDEITLHLSATEKSIGEDTCDLLILSPGVETKGVLATSFSLRASEVIGEVEFAIRNYDGRCIAITGTNGKTTTTELVERILLSAGMRAKACGNYGVPVSEVVMAECPPGVLALEVSSFQLETVVDFRPDVAVWLNFAPDHMDRYPDVASYKRAKLRIFENQGAEQIAVIRTGEDLPNLSARKITFSTVTQEANWFSDGQTICREGVEVMNLAECSRLRGVHNAENAMAAMAACEALGVDVNQMEAAFTGYSPPRHRCELVEIVNGVEWINDSKATNLHALECAIRSQTRPLILIAGGKDKGLDYSGLVNVLRDRVVKVITFGQIAEQLAAVLGSAVETESCHTLNQAVAGAHRIAKSGSTVMLSPGTSSFDQFTGYEDRGDEFCKLVLQL